MSRRYDRAMAAQAQVEEAKAARWRAEAERLQAAIRAHRQAVTVDENFGADEALWQAVGLRTRCPQGHLLEDALIRSDGRRCRTCHREREAARRAAQREAVAA